MFSAGNYSATNEILTLGFNMDLQMRHLACMAKAAVIKGNLAKIEDKNNIHTKTKRTTHKKQQLHNSLKEAFFE